MPTDRVTTKEAAAILGGRVRSEAVALLRAAGVPSTRLGGGYLWDVEGVMRLQAVLHRADIAPATPSTEPEPVKTAEVSS